jgi:hypothetical protein
MKIHENMLFRWVGYDIEMGDEYAKLTAPKRPLIPLKNDLSDEQREIYLDRLRDAFDPDKVLRVSRFDCQDKVGKQNVATDPRDCLFFTEQAAGDAEGHFRRYGRMGFGFSKRAIFNQGGSPVIYTGGKHAILEKSIDILRKHLSISNAGKDVADALEVFARYVKVSRMPESDDVGKKPSLNEKRERIRSKRQEIDSMAYPMEKRIRFLAEREWRLVHNPSQRRRWVHCSADWLWYRPELGRELQVVILPDNRTLSMAIDCDKIRKSLISKSRPPVQLITADALKKI